MLTRRQLPETPQAPDNRRTRERTNDIKHFMGALWVLNESPQRAQRNQWLHALGILALIVHRGWRVASGHGKFLTNINVNSSIFTLIYIGVNKKLVG